MALDRRLAPAANKTRAYYETLSFSAAGIELGLSVVIGALFGRWLDGQTDTTPLFMILLTVIGFAAGVRAMVRAGRKATRTAGASKP
ncbi:MAG TPA: AtpZ/AtpI family protein [Kofleriaceae bacterium]|nr:AtpZ/AtpI family protein [Kofleriaceae bacterium]